MSAGYVEFDPPLTGEALQQVEAVCAANRAAGWGVDDPSPATFTTHDGWVIDEATGEILGHADDREKHTDLAPFNRGYAEWVLQKMQDAQALIVADEIKLRAISELIQTRIKRERRKLDWLEKRFGADLQEFARVQLLQEKGRTIVLDHGKLSFRRSAGSIKVIDAEYALDWAREHAPEAIKVSETVLVGPLKGREDLPPDFFEVRGPEDRFTVETGIKA